MGTKDIITIITASIGCITGVSGLILNLLSRYSTPKYRVLPHDIAISLPENLSFDENYNLNASNIKLETSEPSQEAFFETINEQIFLNISLFIVNLSSSTQHFLGARFTYSSKTMSSCTLYEQIPYQSIQPQSNVPLTMKFNIGIKYIQKIAPSIQKREGKLPFLNEDIGEIILYLSSGTLLFNLRELFQMDYSASSLMKADGKKTIFSSKYGRKRKSKIKKIFTE